MNRLKGQILLENVFQLLSLEMLIDILWALQATLFTCVNVFVIHNTALLIV